jgi:hypothetical protein
MATIVEGAKSKNRSSQKEKSLPPREGENGQPFFVTPQHLRFLRKFLGQKRLDLEEWQQ